MHKLHTLTVGLGALALVSIAPAQFDGPAPLAWRFTESTRVAPGGSPLVLGERIYQSIGGRVVCIDKETGNLRFRFPAIDPIPGVFRTSPVRASNGLVVVGGDNRIIYAFNAETGELKWSYTIFGGLYGTPVAVGKYIVVAQSDNKLVALDADTGEPAWHAPFNVLDGINGSIAASGNSVVFFTNRYELKSLDVVARKFDWSLRLSVVPPNAVPIVFGQDIYLVSGPYLVVVNAASGSARQFPTGLNVNQAPAVSEYGVFLVSVDGKATILDPQTRRPVITKPIELGTQALLRPSAAGQSFVVPTTSGGFVVVDSKTNAVTWNYLIRPLDERNEGNNPAGGGGGGGGSMMGGAGGGPQGGGANNGNNNNTRPMTVQASAPVLAGGNTLLVPAKDGTLLAFDKVTGVDLTAPKVQMIFPNPGDQVSGQPPLLLAFRLEDNASGIKLDTVKVKIDGKDFDSTFTRDGLLIVRFSQSGKNRALTDGRKEILVTAVDWLGNTANIKFALSIDNTLTPVQVPGSQNPNQPRGGAGGLGGRGGDGV